MRLSRCEHGSHSTRHGLTEPLAQEIFKFNWTPFEDARVDSLTWRMTDSVRPDGDLQCGPPYCNPSIITWSGYGRACELSIDGRVVSRNQSGSYPVTLYWYDPGKTAKFRCTGWGPPAERSVCDPFSS